MGNGRYLGLCPVACDGQQRPTQLEIPRVEIETKLLSAGQAKCFTPIVLCTARDGHVFGHAKLVSVKLNLLDITSASAICSVYHQGQREQSAHRSTIVWRMALIWTTTMFLCFQVSAFLATVLRSMHI